MLPAFIKPENVSDFRWSPDRPKAHGRMYGGEAKAEVNGVKFTLKLWYHGGDNESQRSLLPCLSIATVNGRDVYWTCLFDDEHLWQHPVGWFRDDELRERLAHQGNPNMGKRALLPEDEMVGLGFVKLF